MADLGLRHGDRATIDVTLATIPNDLMGGDASATLTARWRTDSPASVLEVAAAINISGDKPVLSFPIAPADTSWLPKERVGLVYDVEVSPSDDSGPLTVESGRLLVSPDVTRP